MTRLRAVNPAAVDPERGRGPTAQAALQRILQAPRQPGPSSARRAVPPRALALVLGVLVLGAGGTLAATDPLGWWSSNPGEAHYRVNPDARVPTPGAQQIRCRANAAGGFRCLPETEKCDQVGDRSPQCTLSGTGVVYAKIDTIRSPPSSTVFSRTGFTKAIAAALTARRMTAAQATRFRADLSRVPDSFFAELRLAASYGTYGSGDEIRGATTRVPPVGQPGTLVCTGAGVGLSCRDLNGDTDAPVGAGVYSAVPGPGWRTVRGPRFIGGLPPGIRFTPAEERVIVDLLQFGTTTHSGTRRARATPVPVTHLRRTAAPAR